MFKPRWWPLVAALYMWSGCGGGKSQSGSLAPGDIKTGEDFCRSLNEQMVSFYSRCYGGTEAYWREIIGFGCDQLGTVLAAGGIVYDPKEGADCLKRISQMSCSPSESLESCDEALRGRLPAGNPCDPHSVLASACAPGTFCFSPNNTCGGTCQPHVQPGESCADTATTGYVSCAFGSTCGNHSQLCSPNLAEGQPCRGTIDGECQSGLYCDGATSGTCRKQQTSGSCDPFLHQCEQGYNCAGPDGAKKCTKWKMPGDSCTPGWSECYFMLSCGSDGRCSNTEVAENQPCGWNSQDESVDCSKGLYCAESPGSSMGSCQKKRPAGAACAAAAECEGNGAYCDPTTKRCIVCN
jgi:hypothetical protein